MDAYSIPEAAARLDDLIGRVEAGESVEIAREGHVVARLVPMVEPAGGHADPRRRELLDRIRGVAKTLPFDPVDSVAEMRRQARY